MGKPRYFATTRQLTGTPFVYHAYVYDRLTGKVVCACRHAHGARGQTPEERDGHGKAMKCAEKMMRAHVRKHGNPEI